MGVSMDGGLQAGLSGLTHAFPCCKLKIEARRLSMDGLEYLKKDHDRFRQLFRHAENAKDINEKWRIFRIIKQELDLHAQAEEAGEDTLLLSGAGDGDINEPIRETYSARVRWLVANLGTALLASSIVGFFGGAIEHMVALAALMPIVAGVGGNAGTQTSLW